MYQKNGCALQMHTTFQLPNEKNGLTEVVRFDEINSINEIKITAFPLEKVGISINSSNVD